MRRSTLCLPLVFGLILSVAGCSGSPAPAEATTKSDTTLPEGITKTKKGVLKGKMTHDVRKKVLGAGLEE